MALVILGAAAGLVVVTMPPPEPPLAVEARALAARLTVAAEEAVVSGRPVGVVVDADGYAFRRRIAGEWLAIDDDPALAPRTWPDGVVLDVQREGVRIDARRLDPREPGLSGADDEKPAAAAPVARFDPEGAATAVTLDLRDEEGGYRVAVDAAGVVSLAADEAG